MLVNTKWLRQYLQPACSDEQMVNAFSIIGLEIEEHIDLAEELKRVIIGFVRDKQPVSDNNNLFLCQVEVTPGQTVPIACAATYDVPVGKGVPVALPGVKLPTGVVIKEGNVHGHNSSGMICCDGELGLMAQDTGLRTFDDESLIGKSITSAITIDESLVDLNILPNRPDCLGTIGVAREVAAHFDLNLVYPNTELPDTGKTDPSTATPARIDEPELCPRYMCQRITGVKVAPSPPWLQNFLLAIGSRPINNIVDITNYVLFEWGQPLHAFDHAYIEGNQIIVRRMKPEESLTLLDDRVIDGKTQPLVIADANKPVALAGIMGGANSQTDDQSTDILLEAACFDSVCVRKSARALNVSSDSSYRFERGTDPNRMLIGAMKRACSLILELAGGRLNGSLTDTYPTKREPKQLKLTPERVSSYLGLNLDAPTIRKSLAKLEIEADDTLNIHAPTWRVDINHPVVLIEDIARIVGFDQIPLQPRDTAGTLGGRSATDQVRQQVTGTLIGAGFLECRNLPLEPGDTNHAFRPLTGDPVKLQNPMRADMTYVRTSLIPGLLRVIDHNVRHGATSYRFFEFDRTFEQSGESPIEAWSIAAVAAGPIQQAQWSGDRSSYDFHHLKGIAENLLDQCNAPTATFQHIDLDGFTPGATAAIKLNDQTIGVIGQINPKILKSSRFQLPLYAFELNLESFITNFDDVKPFTKLVRTPPVTRDLAFVANASVTYAQLEQTIHDAAAQIIARDAADSSLSLQTVACIDEYRGKQIPSDCRSLALRLVFRDPTRTLTADEVNHVMEHIQQTLTATHGAELRV